MTGMPVLRGRFDIPIPPLTETEDEKRKRIAEVDELLSVMVEVFERQLGQDLVRARLIGLTKRSRGARKGSRAPDRDRRLLAEYDAEATRLDGKRPSIAALAERLYGSGGSQFGTCAESVARQLWRLVDNRKKREAKAAPEHEGNLPGILGQLWRKGGLSGPIAQQIQQRFVI